MSTVNYAIEDVHQPGLVGRWEPQYDDDSEPISASGETFQQLCVAAKALQDQEKFSAAIDKYSDALKLGRAPYGYMSFAYSNIGLCYVAVEIFDRALNYHQCHLECTRVAGDEEMEIVALTNMGICQTALQNYEAAIEDHERALGLATKLKNQLGQMQAFANLGNVYAYMGKFQEAVVYHEQQLRVARDLQLREAEGRAAFNLQSDHNSLGHYDVADTYARKKMATTTGRIPLNAGYSDCKPSVEVQSGWMVKHKGAAPDSTEPDKLGTKRMWCVLREGIFGYHEDTRAGLKARRYIKMADVISVTECALQDDDRTQPTRSLKLLTEDRSFFFTCDTAKDCADWIEALKKAKSAFVPFIADGHGFLGASSRSRLAAPASNFFDASPANQRRDTASRVQNPLFVNSYLMDDEDYDLEQGHLDVSNVPESGGFGGTGAPNDDDDDDFQADIQFMRPGPAFGKGTEFVEMEEINTAGAWATEETVQRSVQYLGAKPIKAGTVGKGTPSVSDVHSVVQDLIKQNRIVNVDLTVTDKQILARTAPTFSFTPQDINVHTLSSLSNVMNFDKCVAIVFETYSVDQVSYECTVYRCNSVAEATALKSVIAGRNAGQPPRSAGRVEVNEAYVEESQMMTTALPVRLAGTLDRGYLEFKDLGQQDGDRGGYLSVQADGTPGGDDDDEPVPLVRALSIPAYDQAKLPRAPHSPVKLTLTGEEGEETEAASYFSTADSSTDGVFSTSTFHGVRVGSTLSGPTPGESALTDSDRPPLDVGFHPGETSSDHAADPHTTALAERAALEQEASAMVDLFYAMNDLPHDTES